MTTWTLIENSKAISQVGYDLGERTLIIQSLNGTQYSYLNVPPEVHQSFLAEPSKGKAWADIKKTYGLACDPARPTAVAKAAAKPAPTKVAPEPATGIVIAPFSLPFEQKVEQLRSQMDRHFEALVTEIDDLAKRATTLTVTDQDSFTAAAELGKQLAARRKYVTELMKPTKQAIDSVKAVVLDKEKELLAIAQAGEDRLSRICTDYRVAEQRRAQEAADAERRRLLTQAEDNRIEQAERAQAAGQTRLADALLSTPVTAPKVEVKAAVPKVAGVKGKVLYKWRVADETKIPRGWLTIDEKKIGQYARDNKLADKTVLNGIEFYQEPDTDF